MVNKSNWHEQNKDKVREYQREYMKKYRAENKEKTAAANKKNYWKNRDARLAASRVEYRETKRGQHLLKKYGMTEAQYDELLLSPGGKCAICSDHEAGGRHGVFHVDHDHVTGKVRGILCDKCNRGLGYFNDDPEAIRQAIQYLQKAEQRASVQPDVLT